MAQGLPGKSLALERVAGLFCYLITTMPYHIISNDGKHCVAKEGEDMPIKGGCHATEQEAKDHMAALYANEGEGMKAGARHNAKDRQNISETHRKAGEIMQHMMDLGAETDTPEQAAAKANDLPAIVGSVSHTASVKAVGDMRLELKIAFHGPKGGKDSQGEYFDRNTDLDEENFPTPPVTYYHGFSGKGRPSGKPIFVGKSIKRETRADGHYITAQLKAGNEYAEKVYKAALAGQAVVSPGTVLHLTRPMPRKADGHLEYWPIAEIAVWDFKPGMEPANAWSVAVPVLKSLYEEAGITVPALFETNDSNTDKPEAEDIDPTGSSDAADGETVPTNSLKGLIDMDEKELAKMIADNVAAAMKSASDAQAAEDERKRKEQERIDVAVKAAEDKWNAEAAKGRRLPIGGKAPHQAQYGATRKFDNLDAGDTALMIEVLQAAAQSGYKAKLPSEGAFKALALKLNEAKDEVYIVAKNAMKAAFADNGIEDIEAAMKANELNHSTQAGFGDEWVGVAYSTRLWEVIRQETFVAEKLMARAIEVPPGYESIYLPLEGADLTWYKVAQATANNATTGIPDATVTASKIATDRASLTLVKMGARGVWSGEMEEDSLIPFVANLRRQLELGGAEQLEHAIIDGDTATGATTNINDIGGTPAGTEVFLLVNGFRKSPLVTTTANSRSGGTLSVEDYIETAKMMGLAGRNAKKKSEVEFITDLLTGWKSLELAEVKTKDVFSNPTLENGELTGIWGYKVRQSAFMHYANQDATYGLKANTAGKTDLDTAANNTTGSILAVRYDQWQFGIRRRMTIETQRIPQADATQIVALMRWGLTQRDTEASAVTYNLTV